jgi:hypothetical protein
MPRDKKRHGGCIPDKGVYKSDQFLTGLCNKQGNVLIGDQPRIVISFSRRAARLLKDVREAVAMQGVYFIEQFAQGAVIVGRCSTNVYFHYTSLSSFRAYP